MRTPLFKVLLASLVAGTLWGCVSPVLGEPPPLRRLQNAPAVLSYDWDADEFEYSKSVLSPGYPGRPGGPLAYYGNRLTQFMFVGPPEMAGIYGAMQHYKWATHRDPAKHQYRWRGYSK